MTAMHVSDTAGIVDANLREPCDSVCAQIESDKADRKEISCLLEREYCYEPLRPGRDQHGLGG